MSILHAPVTRDMEIKENNDGYYYFVISEGGKEIHESDLYQFGEECAQAGVKFLDAFHEESPLRSDYIPTVADFVHVIDGDKK